MNVVMEIFRRLNEKAIIMQVLLESSLISYLAKKMIEINWSVS